MSNTLREWLEVAPHLKDCAAFAAKSDRACTCGKLDALFELDELEEQTNLACQREHV